MASYYCERASEGYLKNIDGVRTFIPARPYLGAASSYRDGPMEPWSAIANAVHAKGPRFHTAHS
jgi:N-ethylmaleimide reductase